MLVMIIVTVRLNVFMIKNIQMIYLNENSDGFSPLIPEK